MHPDLPDQVRRDTGSRLVRSRSATVHDWSATARARTASNHWPSAASCAIIVAVILAGCTPAAVLPGSQTSGSPTPSESPRETAVPAPGGGDIDETVASVEPGEITEAAIGSSAILASAVTVSVLEANRLDVGADTPGEIAGSAVAATVRIENNTDAAIDLGSTVVTLTDAQGNPGRSTTAGPFDPFTETAAPGEALDGVYIFGVPADALATISISVSYAGGAPVALFTGPVS